MRRGRSRGSQASIPRCAAPISMRPAPGGVFTEPLDHGLGRSRGGFTTKLHLAVEQGQRPMSIVVTAGQRGDSPQFEPVLGKVRVPRIGPGRPRVRPDRVRADKAYASRKNATARSSAPAAAGRRVSTRPTTASVTRWSPRLHVPGRDRCFAQQAAGSCPYASRRHPARRVATMCLASAWS
ncbi:transposase [Streptomyces kanamyceticus]|uniref:transposase n=1 Tax=Streptomyces kanamyceticus TaxID=1967 RepID=UPI0037DCF3EE